MQWHRDALVLSADAELGAEVRERRDQSFEVRRLRGGRQVEIVGVQRRTVKPGATPPISTYLTAWPSNARRIRSGSKTTSRGRRGTSVHGRL